MMSLIEDINKVNKRIELERMVLGCMIKHPDIMEYALSSLSRAHFTTPDHIAIYEAICGIAKKHLCADTYLIKAMLPDSVLNNISSEIGIAALVLEAGTQESGYTLIKMMQEYHGVDKLKEVLVQSMDNLKNGASNLEGLIDFIQANLLKISLYNVRSEGVDIKSVLQGDKIAESFIEQLQKKQAHFMEHGTSYAEASQETIPTGFYDIDKKIGGLVKSNLIIIAARPSMGKTSLAINIAEHVAIKQKVPVCILSLEMSTAQLVERLIASRSKVDIHKVRGGNVSASEFQDILHAVKELENTNIIFNDASNLTINSITSIVRRLKTAFDIKVLIVDYIQLISGKSGTTDSRQQVISEISRGLKIIARELDIPVIALSQLSRKVEERPGHRPQMSDLRESGSIEQDADQVCFLLRPEYYEPNDRPGLAELIIAKNRHGATGTVLLGYTKETSSFSNYAHSSFGTGSASFDGIT